MNLQFSLIYRDQQNPDGSYIMRTFESPSFLRGAEGAANLWDVCFFSYPFIIETNLFVQNEPAKADQYFSYYTKLQVFLKNRKDGGVKFSEELGFDSEGVFRMNDTWVDPGIFENALANELLGQESQQKLWDHDQKKTLKKYYMKKESEESVIKI